MTEFRKLKRAVIKEEYIAITGDLQKAVILNQFIYWAERVKDFDLFIQQENERAVQNGMPVQDMTYGWMYKTAQELSDETMLGLSNSSMRVHIKALMEKGFISERNNPKYKWDRTKQYRVNLLEIMDALKSHGYKLENYTIEHRCSKSDFPISETENRNFISEHHNAQNETAIPEITTTEITTEITNKKERKKENSYDEILNTVKNEELRETFSEFIKMRKLTKNPMTDRALQMLIKKVEFMYPGDIELQKKVLDNAIINNWKSVYPLKPEEIPQQKKKLKYDDYEEDDWCL